MWCVFYFRHVGFCIYVVCIYIYIYMNRYSICGVFIYVVCFLFQACRVLYRCGVYLYLHKKISYMWLVYMCGLFICVVYIYMWFAAAVTHFSANCQSTWLWLVASLKTQVSFAEYSLFYRALLQKRGGSSDTCAIIFVSLTINCHTKYIYT